jgi:DNA-binding IclR family transcriptional regulator
LFDRLLSEPLTRFTATTITDPTVLRDELAAVRVERSATCCYTASAGVRG